MSTGTAFHRKRMLYIDHESPERKYTEGRCGEFAMALFIEFGYHIVSLDTQASDDPYHKGQGLHAFCRDSDGNLVDVYGKQTIAEAYARWDKFKMPSEQFKLRPINLPWRQRGWRLNKVEIEVARSHIRLHFDRYAP